MPRNQPSKGRMKGTATRSKSGKARPELVPPAAAPAVSKVAHDALERYELKLKQDEETLAAKPEMVAWARSSERWRKAQEAAQMAAAPYRGEIDRFLKLHGNGYPPDSELSKQFDALVWALEEAKLQALAEHGFVPASPPRTVTDLRGCVRQYDPEPVLRQVQLAGLPRPSDAYERESDDLWASAEKIQSATPSLPRLPTKPARGVERLSELRAWCDRCAVAEAYAAASAFVHDLGALAFHTRARRERDIPERVWKKLGGTYATAFIAWVDMMSLMTPDVRDAARGTRGLDWPVVRIGKCRPSASVLEAVADELGTAFRNALYLDRQHPLEPDVGKIAAVAKAEKPMGYGDLFQSLLKKETNTVIRARLGIQTWGDALLLMVAEWEGQSPERVPAVFSVLRFGEVDFDELEICLAREARVATTGSQPIARIDSAPAASGPINPPPSGEPPMLGAWYCQAVREYGRGLVELKPGDFSRRRNELDARRAPGAKGLWLYPIERVIAHPFFAVYKDAIHKARDESMPLLRGKPRGPQAKKKAR